MLLLLMVSGSGDEGGSFEPFSIWIVTYISVVNSLGRFSIPFFSSSNSRMNSKDLSNYLELKESPCDKYAIH